MQVLVRRWIVRTNYHRFSRGGLVMLMLIAIPALFIFVWIFVDEEMRWPFVSLIKINVS